MFNRSQWFVKSLLQTCVQQRWFLFSEVVCFIGRRLNIYRAGVFSSACLYMRGYVILLTWLLTNALSPSTLLYSLYKKSAPYIINVGLKLLTSSLKLSLLRLQKCYIVPLYFQPVIIVWDTFVIYISTCCWRIHK